MSLQGVDYEARCMRLEAEAERLRAQALSMTVYAWGQEARIEAALAKVEGVCHCEEWLKPPCLPCEIRKALKGGSDAE